MSHVPFIFVTLCRYFSQLWKSDMIFDVHGSFASLLPESRKDIASKMYMDKIHKVPFIHEVEDTPFKEILCSHLMYDFAMPGDILCGMGINDDQFLIILSGNGAVLGQTIEDVTMRLYSGDTLNNHILTETDCPTDPVMVVAESRTEFLFMNSESARTLGAMFPRTIDNLRQKFERAKGLQSDQNPDDAMPGFSDMTHIASEIKNLEKIRHISSSELDLLERASKKMPSFCCKLALKTIEDARTPSSHFESSMKQALIAMQTIFVENDVNDNFSLMKQNSKTYVDPSLDVFAASEISTSDRSETATKIENRYGAASKRWKTVVKNFMNASRFSGLDRFAMHTLSLARLPHVVYSGILG
jgi:hypothetical protein